MIICDYTCEGCEIVFEASVESPAPDNIDCPGCEGQARWMPSASVACRVKRWEVVRGKWEKPERKTYLDTRKLGEGQSIEEFRAERRRVWEERRKEHVMEMLK